MLISSLTNAWIYINKHGGHIETQSCSSPVIDRNDLYLYTWLVDANGNQIAEVHNDDRAKLMLLNHCHNEPFHLPESPMNSEFSQCFNHVRRNWAHSHAVPPNTDIPF